MNRNLIRYLPFTHCPRRNNVVLNIILGSSLLLVTTSCFNPTVVTTTEPQTSLELEKYFSEATFIIDRYEQAMSHVVDANDAVIKLISEPVPMQGVSNMTAEEILKSFQRAAVPGSMTDMITKTLFQLRSDSADFAVLLPPTKARDYHSLIERSLIKSMAALESWLNFWNSVKKSNRFDSAILEQGNRHYHDAVEFLSQALLEMNKFKKP